MREIAFDSVCKVDDRRRNALMVVDALPFDDQLRPKPAYHALQRSLDHARSRRLLWRPPRG